MFYKIMFFFISYMLLFYHNVSAEDDTKSNIKLFVNNQQIENLTMEPVIKNDYLLVPVREVFEPLNSFVEYIEHKNEVSIVYNENLIVYTVDSNLVKVNEDYLTMEVEAQIINGKLLVPLRYTAEAIGLKVGWDSIQRAAYINEKTVNTIISSNEEDIQIIVVNKDEEIESTSSSSEKTEEIKEINNTKPNDESIVLNESGVKDVSNFEINQINAKKTTVHYIGVPKNDEIQKFVLGATSEISAVDRQLLDDGRLVLDIKNAQLKMDKNNIILDNSQHVKEIRFGESIENNITNVRVVFELKNNTHYSITISKDRKYIDINFRQTFVNEVQLKTQDATDYIDIKTSSDFLPNIEYKTNPERIIILYKNSTNKSQLEQKFDGIFVKSIDSVQSFDNSVITVYLKKQALYKLNGDGKNLSLIISQPTFKNIEYDFDNKVLKMKKDENFKIDLDKIDENDNYNNLKYNFEFDTDISQYYGVGEYIIDDKYLYSFELLTKNNRTSILLNENQILAPSISEDEQYYYLKINTSKEVYNFIIILDPGHGGDDPGAIKNGVIEKEINEDIAKRVYDLIKQNSSMKAYFTRTSDYKMPLNDRASFGNKNGDIFISVHNNSNPNSSPKGTEVYYHTHFNDDILGFSSKQLAQIMQNNLVKFLGSFDRQIKHQSYAVIRNTTIPAVLLEVGFISNVTEAKKLADPEYRQKAANAVYNSLLEVYEIYKPKRD